MRCLEQSNQSIETENRAEWLLPGAAGENGDLLFNGCRVQFEKMENSGDGWWWWRGSGWQETLCAKAPRPLCAWEEEWGLVDGRGWLPVAVGRIWHVGGKVMGLKSYPCQVMSEPQFLPL